MTDELLWKELQNGNQGALKRIYDEHIVDLLQYGCRFTGAKEMVEDCVHDLFIYLWQNRSSLGNTHSIKSYLLVSLRRRIFKHLKKESVIDSKEPVSFEAGLSVEDKWILAEDDAEKHRALQEAFAALSDRQKEAIYLRYYQQMNYQSISQVMDINYQSVRNLIHNGIQGMRKVMAILACLTFLLLA
ncbi:MAG: sigma-70 family RNA polymerase sigma factor [Saprospiraceae bacterium]|nr:sigma-70 family RNA polymerase sigma factor [Saprospiraceae bacterium]